MDYSRFLNEVSASRTISPLRALNATIARSATPFINLAAGLPNSNLYPFKSMVVTLRDGSQITLEGELLSTALQYGPSDGYPKLVDELREYQQKLHNLPMTNDWSLAMTSGSQDAMCKAFEMMLNIGDYVIAEEYIYSGTLAILKPYHVNHLKVKGDGDGLIPSSLREILARWNPEDIKTQKTGVPKILYTIPNGGNPVGTSISAARRKEIYKIAQEYNLIIFEDDPYFFLSFGKEKKPSFLSMDVDGRVLRFDSFSKVMTSGIRLGFVTGPQFLVQRIVLHIQASQLHSSSEAQVIIHETLKRWGYNGFLEHTDKVAKFYESRRDRMVHYAKKWLTGLAEWNEPSAGMFLWIKVLGLKDTHNLVSNRLFKKYVAFLPGKACNIDSSDTPYIRASFSIASDEEMNKGLQLLAECIKEELNTNGNN
ncbi:hypothetical protein CHUAL_005481 [Chamberlinius hualienensis]